MAEKVYSKKVTIKEIVDFFGYEQLTGDEESLKRWTVVPDVNRPGFELSGIYKETDPRRIVILGNKESEFIETMSVEDQKMRFPWLCDGLTPAMIITNNNELPVILQEIATANNFPILRTNQESYRVIADMTTFLDEKLAPEESIHGVLLSVHNQGVLITGESGMGKSETALDLIRNGHVLISDDRVDVVHIHNALYGHAPVIIQGLLEIRGIGVIDVEKMFGASALSDSTKIDLIIHLVPFSQDAEYNRIGDEEGGTVAVLGVSIPRLILPVSAGRNTSALVESAVTNFILQKKGFNSAEEIKNRFRMYSGKADV